MTFFAIAIGSLIGRVRGGRWSGVSSAELRSTPLLVISIATVLVQAILNPVFPVIWSLVGACSLIAFGLRNRHLVGMSIVVIGTMLNLLPLLANWATPVSELALISVGDLDPFDMPDIDGARQSSSEATRLTFLGDAIPVPIVGSVVSIGDIIALVGVADIFTNLFLRGRTRELSLAEAGVSFDGPAHSDERVSILSPLETGSRKSSDSQRRRAARNKAAPVSHVPAHAASSPDSDVAESASDHVPSHAIEEPDSSDDAVGRGEPVEPIVIDLTESAAPAHAATDDVIDLSQAEPDSNVVPAHAAPAHEPEVDAIAAAGLHAVQIVPAVDESHEPDPVPELIDLTDQDDPRPIIDLTKSPTDEQMNEFLRRRKAADRDHARLAARAPGQRRGRAPVRLRADNADGVVESSR